LPEPLADRATRQSHTERAVGFRARNLDADDAATVLALERHFVPTGIKNHDRQWLEIVLARSS
jgi:hypothetical protein